MVDLKPKTPCAGLLPIAVEGCGFSEIDLECLTTIAPFADEQEAVSRQLKAAYGLAYPAPNQALEGAQARILWFGRDMALLCGPAPDAGLANHAALTDQSDAWACTRLEGPKAADVLARVVPVDLRAQAFGEGRTCCTLLGHMNVSITRLSQDAFMVLVFRSMARTLVHELQQAMAGVAARG